MPFGSNYGSRTRRQGVHMEVSSEAQVRTGLGQRLSLLAKLKGLTQDQIAKQCLMSRISVNRFFKEHTELRASDFKALLTTLGINLDQIIDQEIQRQMFGDRETVMPERVLAAVK